ncbi:MAG TPA: tetratricopeptide repeat protein [Spirochaetota bacterium]|nr:tetratricopeptide repeat protein [Spirochaetota bacterium]
MRRITAALIAAFLIPLMMSCKKSDAELREDAMRADQAITEQSEINKEIKKLQDQLSGAADDYQRSQIYSKIAGLYSEKGDTSSSMKNAREAIKYQPNEYYSRYLLGKAYLDAGRYNEAETELLTSIDLKNDFALSHFELGNVYYKKIKYGNAVSEYKLAIKLDEQCYQAYNNMGVIHSLTGKGRDAVDILKKGIKINPEFPVFYKNLGIVYDTVLKKPKDAAENYEKYLELRPDCPERKSVEAWIDILER